MGFLGLGVQARHHWPGLPVPELELVEQALALAHPEGHIALPLQESRQRLPVPQVGSKTVVHRCPSQGGVYGPEVRRG